MRSTAEREAIVKEELRTMDRIWKWGDFKQQVQARYADEGGFADATLWCMVKKFAKDQKNGTCRTEDEFFPG